MAVAMLVMYVVVTLPAILYSGVVSLRVMFGLDLTTAVWIIGISAAAYTVYGGLKAVVRSDLIGNGARAGRIPRPLPGAGEDRRLKAFTASGADKLHVIQPADHPDIPWTVLLLGIWIPRPVLLGAESVHHSWVHRVWGWRRSGVWCSPPERS
jgi:SSS family solute:Na+ symporter